MMKMHNEVRKAKEEGRRESEKKSQACYVSFKLQTLKSCYNSAHAQTSNFAPSSDDYKVQTKYTASKQLFGKT